MPPPHRRRNLDDYTWQEETVARPVNKSPDSKTWDHFQIDGLAYKKLVARNGKPLSAADARKEQAKMVSAFDFKLEGEETIAGAAWSTAGTPGPGFKPTSRE